MACSLVALFNKFTSDCLSNSPNNTLLINRDTNIQRLIVTMKLPQNLVQQEGFFMASRLVTLFSKFTPDYLSSSTNQYEKDLGGAPESLIRFIPSHDSNANLRDFSNWYQRGTTLTRTPKLTIMGKCHPLPKTWKLTIFSNFLHKRHQEILSGIQSWGVNSHGTCIF